MTRARNLARLVPDTNGLIPDSNIGAVATSKLTGQVADASISGLSASKVSGQLSDANMSEGSVIQTLYFEDGTGYSTTSSTYQAGASASITPRSTSSRIAVEFSSVLFTYSPSAYEMRDLALYRNGALIKQFENNDAWYASNGTIATNFRYRGSVFYIDSPASTSPVTYQLYHRARLGSGSTVYLESTRIILMEIAG